LEDFAGRVSRTVTRVSLQHIQSRLVALELLRLMIPLVDDQIILDRILPYVVRTRLDLSMIEQREKTGE
jgi:hypothetical protein